MSSRRSDRILEEWSAIAARATRPAVAPRRGASRQLISRSTLAGATVAIVAVAAIGLWMAGRGPTGPGGDPTLSPRPTPTATVPATPTAVPTVGPCEPANVAARVVQWEGAAGSRIAQVELTNAGSDPCQVAAVMRPQLVDARGSILLDGATPADASVLTIGIGDVLTTSVRASNYCGADPTMPVTVAFDLGDGTRIVAAPAASGTDLPPCNGPGQPGTIEMQPWQSR
ncbi:MAG TPA: DUF4232 domain-containing protein [Candidatus Limnocylindrales bacterium]|jgi:hypothetical protein